jgi:hypothetical protein
MNMKTYKQGYELLFGKLRKDSQDASSYRKEISFYVTVPKVAQIKEFPMKRRENTRV